MAAPAEVLGLDRLRFLTLSSLCQFPTPQLLTPNRATWEPWESGIEELGVSVSCGCGSVVKLLADYLERRLPPPVREELDAHLRRCPRCVTQLRTYESTVSLLRSLREDELPPELRLTLKSFIDARCQNN